MELQGNEESEGPDESRASVALQTDIKAEGGRRILLVLLLPE